MNADSCQYESQYPTLPFSILSCPSLLLAWDSTGRGVKGFGLTPLGEPMPNFFLKGGLNWPGMECGGGGGGGEVKGIWLTPLGNLYPFF